MSKPHSVLLLEDDSAVARSLERLLAARGHTVAVATSCAEARAIASWLHFDVGVIDINLGDGLGTDCASLLLGRGTIGRCIFFTGGAPKRVLDVARRIGPVIPKGDVSELLAALAAPRG